ncbi:MAG: TIGR02996 domain-containing protein [Archangium sp.]|nr:TIGR02996 domain-containing protein [Archangium sp.]MBM4782588.1 TIGR02996 domain-containing protein [Archangiaceae bacterium]
MFASEPISEMFEAVWAAPAELSRRLVLADALIEQNDPRGEFIMLQFETSARARKRSQKLLDRHRAHFLGRLRDVIVPGTDVWSHGFVVEASTTLVGGDAGLRAWATVERLVANLTQHEPRELASPNLVSLRSLSLVPEPVDRWVPWHVREAQKEKALRAVRQWLAKGRRVGVLQRGREWTRDPSPAPYY